MTKPVSEIVGELREDIEQGGDCLVRASELEALLDHYEAMRGALEPFAKYGAVLRGQQTRKDRTLIQLWDYKITGQDLVDADTALSTLTSGEEGE